MISGIAHFAEMYALSIVKNKAQNRCTLDFCLDIYFVSVCKDFGPTVGLCGRLEKWESEYFSFRCFWCLCVWKGGRAWSVDGGWAPLPTCLKQYCDPASLVSLLNAEKN